MDVYSEAGSIKTLIDRGYLEVELKETLGKDVDLFFIGSSMDVSFQKQLEQGKNRIR